MIFVGLWANTIHAFDGWANIVDVLLFAHTFIVRAAPSS